jgi:hypothetical protein
VSQRRIDMPKDMRELIEKTNIDSKLKISWNKIFKQLEKKEGI